MWAHSDQAAICKPGRKLSKEIESAATLTRDFQPPELWENKYPLFMPPSQWCFVTAAWEGEYSDPELNPVLCDQ